MASDGSEGFASRHRRVLSLGAWAVGVLGLVVLYNVSRPGPSVPVSDSGVAKVETQVETIQVGALPVT